MNETLKTFRAQTALGTEVRVAKPSVPTLAVGPLVEINPEVPAILNLTKQPEPLSCLGGGKVFLDPRTAGLGLVAGACRSGGGLNCKEVMGGAGTYPRAGTSRRFSTRQSTLPSRSVEYLDISQWFSKDGPRMCSYHPGATVLEMRSLSSYRETGSEPLHVGPRNLYFNKCPRQFRGLAKV